MAVESSRSSASEQVVSIGKLFSQTGQLIANLRDDIEFVLPIRSGVRLTPSLVDDGLQLVFKGTSDNKQESYDAAVQLRQSELASKRVELDRLVASIADLSKQAESADADVETLGPELARIYGLKGRVSKEIHSLEAQTHLDIKYTVTSRCNTVLLREGVGITLSPDMLPASWRLSAAELSLTAIVWLKWPQQWEQVSLCDARVAVQEREIAMPVCMTTEPPEFCFQPVDADGAVLTNRARTVTTSAPIYQNFLGSLPWQLNEIHKVNIRIEEKMWMGVGVALEDCLRTSRTFCQPHMMWFATHHDYVHSSADASLERSGGGMRYDKGDVITVIMDGVRRQLTFAKNGVEIHSVCVPVPITVAEPVFLLASLNGACKIHLEDSLA